MIAAIDAAEDTVLLETYIWKGDRTGQRFKRALIAAAERGVDVYLVYDVFANLVVPQRSSTSTRASTCCGTGPGRACAAIPCARPGLNHRKVLVVDGAIGFLGGYNIGSLYATRWRDTHLRLHGPAVADLENAFVDYWNQTRRRRLPPAAASPTSRQWDSPSRWPATCPASGCTRSATCTWRRSTAPASGSGSPTPT